MKGLKENFQKINILIIGAGIIGKFTALELAEQGYQVTIVDPAHNKSSSNAALGLLMGHMYQKRNGRSWRLRKESIELWPKWIKFLQKFNKKLKIEKPLIQLTSDNQKFEKLEKFVKQTADQNLKILKKDSSIIKNLNKAFETNNLQGLISYEDGKIEPHALLNTLDIYLKYKKVNFLSDEIIAIKKSKDKWISNSKNDEKIESDAIILCNSLKALDLIDNTSHTIYLKPVLGQAVELYVDDKKINLLSLPRHFSINGKNIMPITKNKIIIGSTDEFSTRPRKDSFESLTNFLEKKPKWINCAKTTKSWYGIRCRPEGEPSPIIKHLETGLILCTGFYKNGFLLAPACTSWVANELKKIF